MNENILCPLNEKQKLELCQQFALASTPLLRYFFQAYGEDSLKVVKDFGKTLSDTLYEQNEALKGKSLREITSRSLNVLKCSSIYALNSLIIYVIFLSFFNKIS